MGFISSYATVLYDGDWGSVTRPLIKEGIPHKVKFKSYRDSFYRFRRAIKVMIGSDDEGEDDLQGALLQVGDEAYLLEILAPTLADLKNIMDQIRTINQQYHQESDYASVHISNFEIEPFRGKFLGSCTVFCRKASGDKT